MTHSEDWQQWIERRIEEQHDRGLHVSVTQPNLKSDVATPALQALLIAVAVGGAVGGLAALLGARSVIAWRWGLGAGLAVFAVVVVVFIFEHRWAFLGPLRLSFERFWASQEPRPQTPKRTPTIVINPLHSHARRAEPVRQVTGGPVLQARATGSGAYEATVAALHTDQDPDPETRELYDLIVRCWPSGSVSRARALEAGISRAAWHRFVGGSRNGQGRESDRGLLARAGAVALTRRGWIPVVPMSAAFCATDALRRYAKAQRARGPGTGPGQGGPTTGGVLALFRRERGGQA